MIVLSFFHNTIQQMTGAKRVALNVLAIANFLLTMPDLAFVYSAPSLSE